MPNGPGKERNRSAELWTQIFKQCSRIWWLFGILLFLIYCIITLRKTYTDESDLKVAAFQNMTIKDFKDNLKIISDLRRIYWANLVRAITDLLICLNENNLPLNILGIRLNNGVEGFLGILSSLVYLYSSQKS